MFGPEFPLGPDQFGDRFLAELDYIREATARMEAMRPDLVLALNQAVEDGRVESGVVSDVLCHTFSAEALLEMLNDDPETDYSANDWDSTGMPRWVNRTFQKMLEYGDLDPDLRAMVDEQAPERDIEKLVSLFKRDLITRYDAVIGLTWSSDYEMALERENS